MTLDAWLISSSHRRCRRFRHRDKQDVLETPDVQVRLEDNQHLAKELEVQQLRNKIQSEVQDRVRQTQREYYLREQMKAIQKNWVSRTRCARCRGTA